MHGHSWNRLIAASWALAAAGILACAGALLDAFLPRGSILGVLAWIAVLALVVAGTIAGFVWGCDKCERTFDDRIDRMMEKGSKRMARRDTGRRHTKTIARCGGG
jgi:hypothetical protein